MCRISDGQLGLSISAAEIRDIEFVALARCSPQLADCFSPRVSDSVVFSARYSNDFSVDGVWTSDTAAS